MPETVIYRGVPNAKLWEVVIALEWIFGSAIICHPLDAVSSRKLWELRVDGTIQRKNKRKRPKSSKIN
jgi:hypothetical protein